MVHSIALRRKMERFDVNAPRPCEGMAAVVTGSSRGLGRAFAVALADAGARVVVNGTSASSVRPTVAAIRAAGGDAVPFVGSVEDDQTCRDLVATCVDAFGGIDVLVNNAGFTRDRSMARMSVDEFADVVRVHLQGTWSCSSAAIAPMRAAGKGSIVNVTSGAGLFGMFGQANYSAAKAGVIGLTRVMDLELHRCGIRVNALAPVAATDMTAVFGGEGVGHAQTFPAPASVAPVVVHLAGEASAGIHGQVLSFDGEELSLWSHPRASATWRRERWEPQALAEALTEEVLEWPHPDRWGAGVTGPR